jgi:hypothetical protein
MSERQSGSMEALATEHGELSVTTGDVWWLRDAATTLAGYWKSGLLALALAMVAWVLYGLGSNGWMLDPLVFALAAGAVVLYRLWTLGQDLG